MHGLATAGILIFIVGIFLFVVGLFGLIDGIEILLNDGSPIYRNTFRSGAIFVSFTKTINNSFGCLNHPIFLI